MLPYLRMMRPDHWFKNVFMLPGVLLAMFFSSRIRADIPWFSILVGLAAACLTASSNYLLNEILDAPHDKHHPDKRQRPLPSGQARLSVAFAVWAILSAAGISLAFFLNKRFGVSSLALWVMGLLYNVPPVRTKDLPYLDVLSEAVNNPIRLAMGWYCTGLGAAPPLSVAMAYWMFGCFLMAVKRFAEYRHIADPERAGNYRKSFRFYNDERLLETIIFYAAFFAMMSGVFISRYCVRLVLAAPMVTFCMAYYLHLGFKPDSPVQNPEHLLTQKKLMALVLGTFLLCAALLFLKAPGFEHVFTPWILPE